MKQAAMREAKEEIGKATPRLNDALQQLYAGLHQRWRKRSVRLLFSIVL